MNYLEKISLSCKNPVFRELKMSSSTNESSESHTEDETYSFVNTRKRSPKVFNETNLNLSDSVEAPAIRDAETFKSIHLSSPQENDVSSEVLSPENERIKHHSNNDEAIIVKKYSERYSIHFTEEAREKPKIISDINVNVYDQIKNSLQPIFNENTSVDSGINLLMNNSQNKSQETDDSLDSSLEDSLLEVGKIPEIILKHLKSLENVINQTIKERGTNDYIQNLFPIFLKEGASGIRLYTKKDIYLEDMCTKTKRSKKSRAAVEVKDYKNVNIYYRSQKNSSSNINVNIGENFAFVNKKKLSNFEIETVELDLSEDEEKNEYGTLAEEEEEEEEEEQKEEKEEEEEEEEKEKEDLVHFNDSICILKEADATSSVLPEETILLVDSHMQKISNSIQDKCLSKVEDIYQKDQLSIEDHLEFEKFSPTVNSTLHNAHEDSNLLIKNNLVPNNYINSLEESILEEDESNESSGIEESLQIQSNVEDDIIMLYGHELETIFEESEEDKRSLSIREKTRAIENATSSNVEENKESEVEEYSNSEITGKLIVNKNSTKTMFQLPFEINADDESTMNIKLEIKVVKKNNTA